MILTDESRSIARPDMAMDEEQTINEAFIEWAIMIGRSKKSINPKVFES